MNPWLREAPTAALLIAMWAWTAAVWDRVPARMPVHWDLYGEVDGWGGRAEGLLIAPVLATTIAALSLALRPGQRGAANPFVWRTGLVGFCAVVEMSVLNSALSDARVDAWLALATGLVMVTVGVAIPELEPSWPMDARRRRAWDEGHRVASGAFIVVGLLAAAVAPMAPYWAYAVLVVGVAVATAIASGAAIARWRAANGPQGGRDEAVAP